MRSHKHTYSELYDKLDCEPEHEVGLCDIEQCESCQAFYAEQNLDWAICTIRGK